MIHNNFQFEIWNARCKAGPGSQQQRKYCSYLEQTRKVGKIISICKNCCGNSARTICFVSIYIYVIRIFNLVQKGKADSEIIQLLQNLHPESAQIWIQILILINIDRSSSFSGRTSLTFERYPLFYFNFQNGPNRKTCFWDYLMDPKLRSGIIKNRTKNRDPDYFRTWNHV